MDLTSDNAYWSLQNGLIGTYPPLDRDVRCEVAVLGAGITGAIIAESLRADKRHVVVLDKRDAGWGSTSASTALLQYEIDSHLCDLTDIYGEAMACAAYRSCYRSRKIDCGFQRVPSVYFASRNRDVAVFRREAAARTKASIPVDYWSSADIAERFPFTRAAALVSEKAAQLDPYRLTHELLAYFSKRGGSVYDRTEVTSVNARAKSVRLATARGFRVTANWLVVASGYETVSGFELGRIVKLRSTFALASEPADGEPWWKSALLWESARPYFYLRTTADNRILMGGEDSAFRNPGARDRQLPKKCAALERRFREWFPNRTFETGYTWAGTFGETKDGLAFIGPHRKYPRCLFALGFGGNGIVYSAVAARAFVARLEGKPVAYQAPFRFER